MSKIDDLINKLCPDGVEYKTIQDLCNISRGRVMSKDYIKNNFGDFPVYSSQTENNGELGKIATYDFDGEYLTWTTDGANAGSVFYRNGKFSVTNVCGLLEVKNSKITTKFLYYVLSVEAPKYVNAGMGNPKLMSNVMSRIKVAVPPLEVQCEIVHILDDFTLLSAELSAELKARHQQYDYYKQKVFDDIKTNNIKHITDIALVKARVGWQRLTRAEYLSNGEYYLITGTDFTTDGNINFESCVYVTKDRYDMDKNIQVHKDDILITKDGTLGKVAILKEEPAKETTLNSGVFRIKVLDDNEVCPKYLYHFFTSKYFKDFVESVKTGSTIPHLTQQGLLTLNIPVPSLEEQFKIVDLLDNFDILANDITEGLPAEIEARQKQYEYYRDKLLTFKELEVSEVQ